MKNHLLCLFLLVSATVHAQDTLPSFSLRNVGQNRIVVGWVNQFTDIKQISIQRSFDSTKNFKSILTVADPTTPENGYVDTKAPNDRMFYRLYILLDKGVYLFSESKRPVLDTVVKRAAWSTSRISDTLYIPTFKTDTLTNFNGTPATANKPPAVEVWKPSAFVYTFRDGYIQISLPEDEKKYNIKFFTMKDELLFELKEIKDRKFKLDKTNFYKSGWYKFELYEDGELKEKNRFLLPKEF